MNARACAEGTYISTKPTLFWVLKRSCLCLSWFLCFLPHSLTSRAEFPSAKAVLDGFGGADLTISKLTGRNWSWRFTKVLLLINVRTLWVYWGCGSHTLILSTLEGKRRTWDICCKAGLHFLCYYSWLGALPICL